LDAECHTLKLNNELDEWSGILLLSRFGQCWYSDPHLLVLKIANGWYNEDDCLWCGNDEATQDTWNEDVKHEGMNLTEESHDVAATLEVAIIKKDGVTRYQLFDLKANGMQKDNLDVVDANIMLLGKDKDDSVYKVSWRKVEGAAVKGLINYLQSTRHKKMIFDCYMNTAWCKLLVADNPDGETKLTGPVGTLDDCPLRWAYKTSERGMVKVVAMGITGDVNVKRDTLSQPMRDDPMAEMMSSLGQVLQGSWMQLTYSMVLQWEKITIDPPPIPWPRKPPDPVTQIQVVHLPDPLMSVPKSYDHDYQREPVINSVNPVEFQRESSVVTQREQMIPLFPVNPGEFQRECNELSPKEQ
jgi:hypothetical protein